MLKSQKSCRKKKLLFIKKFIQARLMMKVLNFVELIRIAMLLILRKMMGRERLNQERRKTEKI